ncbi:MAG: response regulator transcription factor [Clostridiales bacterium]|nr:response regulator transcription factor [Clostridiales bacterium]
MLQIAICDDEKAVRDALFSLSRDMLAKAGEDAQITLFPDGNSLCHACETDDASFDLIFLDIKMDGLDGMDTARRIRACDDKVLIVFITSSAEYVFRGYEVRAFRYILKPELSHSFPLVFHESLDELLHKREDRFCFQFNGESIAVALDDIHYFESDRRILYIHMAKQTYKTYRKLDEVEQALKKKDFVRCHQSFLVNARMIQRVGAAAVTLKTGETLPVSKRRYKETSEAFLWSLR